MDDISCFATLRQCAPMRTTDTNRPLDGNTFAEIRWNPGEMPGQFGWTERIELCWVTNLMSDAMSISVERPPKLGEAIWIKFAEFVLVGWPVWVENEIVIVHLRSRIPDDAIAKLKILLVTDVGKV